MGFPAPPWYDGAVGKRPSFDDRIALRLMESGLARHLPLLSAIRRVKQVDAYIIADDRKWGGVWRTVATMSAFPRCTLLLHHDHVPDAERQLADRDFPGIAVKRYKGGSIREAVRFAESYARERSEAYVITDSDQLEPLRLKIVNPNTLRLLYGAPAILPPGSAMRDGRPRKQLRASWRTLGEGPYGARASAETAYRTTLLAANIARAASYSGFTFNHRFHPGDGYNGYNNIKPFHDSLCQGNFRGWFSDAKGSYRDVPERFFDVNLEDFHRTWQACRWGHSSVMAFRLADIRYHVDKRRQATDAHRDAVYELKAMFKDRWGLLTKPYTTRVVGAYSLALIDTGEERELEYA